MRNKIAHLLQDPLFVILYVLGVTSVELGRITIESDNIRPSFNYIFCFKQIFGVAILLCTRFVCQWDRGITAKNLVSILGEHEGCTICAPSFFFLIRLLTLGQHRHRHIP